GARIPSVQPDVETSQTLRMPHKQNEADEETLTLRKTDPVGVSTMFVVGLITTTLNLVSCGYLLYLVWTLSSRVGFHSSLRLLAYSTVFDMLVGSFFTLSIVYSTLFDSLIAGVGCQAIGFGISLLTASDMLLIGFVAISTYCKVVRNYDLARGRFDCWLLLVVIGIPLVASVVLASFHAFGPEALWCLIDDETLAGKISTAGTVALYFFVMVVVMVCYFMVRKNSDLLVVQSFSPRVSSNYSTDFDALSSHKGEKEIETDSIANLSSVWVMLNLNLKPISLFTSFNTPLPPSTSLPCFADTAHRGFSQLLYSPPTSGDFFNCGHIFIIKRRSSPVLKPSINPLILQIHPV
ncbi:hypothetical protein L0F63_002806, partial [Massospora cicadina]